jgi:hypothetical protein
MKVLDQKYLVLAVIIAAMGIPTILMLDSKALDKSLKVANNQPDGKNLNSFGSSKNKDTFPEKKGFLNSDGKIVITPQYGKVIEEFKDGLAIVDTSFVELKTAKGFQVVDEVSQKPPKYVRMDYEFLTSFGTSQIIDATGKVILQSQDNERFLCYSEGYVVKEVISATFKPRSITNESMIPQPQVSPASGINVVKGWDHDHIKHLSQKLVNIKTGKELSLPPTVKFVDCFSNGLAVVGTGMSEGTGPASIKAKQYGYIGKDGKFVIQPKFAFTQRFRSNGFAMVAREQGKEFFIDRKARRVSDGKGNTIFSEGLAVLYTAAGKQTSTVVDSSRKVVFRLSSNLKFPDSTYDDTVLFSGGLIPVIDRKSGKYGYVNRAGKIVIPTQFTLAYSFVNDIALVRTSGNMPNAFINKKGSIIWQKN